MDKEMKSILYYTDNRLGEPMFSMVQDRIRDSGLPIVSVSLKPLDFGQNIVLQFEPGVTTLNKQILAGLQISTSKYVFFCEHDVMYSRSHFDFTPPRDDKFYYNSNCWRWDYPNSRYVTWDNMRSLSGLCVNRELALKYYIERVMKIERNGWKDDSREPKWSRVMGHEPGRVGNSIPQDLFDYWKSEEPNVDIRHNKTVTKRKVDKEDFKHPPTGWRETNDITVFFNKR